MQFLFAQAPITGTESSQQNEIQTGFVTYFDNQINVFKQLQ